MVVVGLVACGVRVLGMSFSRCVDGGFRRCVLTDAANRGMPSGRVGCDGRVVVQLMLDLTDGVDGVCVCAWCVRVCIWRCGGDGAELLCTSER